MLGLLVGTELYSGQDDAVGNNGLLRLDGTGFELKLLSDLVQALLISCKTSTYSVFRR